MLLVPADGSPAEFSFSKWWIYSKAYSALTTDPSPHIATKTAPHPYHSTLLL
jgi:hypothetical protein